MREDPEPHVVHRPVSNLGCLQHFDHLKTLRASQNSQVLLDCARLCGETEIKPRSLPISAFSVKIPSLPGGRGQNSPCDQEES